MPINVEEVVRENINRTIHLSLATAANNSPWICEVHFAYDENLNIYFRSLSTRRHSKEISKNPNVAGNIIDKFELGESVVGLYFDGEAQMLSDENELKMAAGLLSQRLQLQLDLAAEAQTEEGHKIYKITVKNWYAFGRFGGDHGQKHQLEWNK